MRHEDIIYKLGDEVNILRGNTILRKRVAIEQVTKRYIVADGIRFRLHALKGDTYHTPQALSEIVGDRGVYRSPARRVESSDLAEGQAIISLTRDFFGKPYYSCKADDLLLEELRAIRTILVGTEQGSDQDDS